MTTPLRARELSVAVCQPITIDGDVEGNIVRHAQCVREAHTRLLVFPELSLTGYCLDAAPVHPDAPELAHLREACRATGAVALVGAPVREAGDDLIATLRIDGNGASVVARKMWLHGAENDRFIRGRALGRISVDGWNIGLAICYDTNFNQHTAAFLDPPVDLYVASVLDAPDDAERRPRSVLAARALRVPVAVARFAGATGAYAATSGESFILDSWGAAIAVAASGDGAYASATLKSPSCR